MSVQFGGLDAVLILAVTILLIAARPRGLGEGLAAAFGAVLMIAAGRATPADVGMAAQATERILLFLLGMMVVSAVVDEAGFFDWAAHAAIRASGGRGRLLYVYLYLLGAAITIFLSLDVTAIVFTPIVCASALRLRLKPAPFVFASAFVANTASLTLPVSNLTNMLVYDLLGIDFWSFVRYMAVPNLAALAVNLGIFLALFWSDIPDRFDVPKSPTRSGAERRFLVAAGVGLGAVVVSLVIAGFAGWPLHEAALVGGLGLAALGLGSGRVRPSTIRRGIAWQLPLFVIGMYVVVLGADRAVLGPLWGELLRLGAAQPTLGVVALAFGTGLGANLVNNIPMSLVAITALQSLPGPRELLSFAAVIGTNLGPNVSVFGSLATMLVLTAARQRGIRITPGEYFRVGLLTTPPMIAAAVLLLVVGGPA